MAGAAAFAAGISVRRRGKCSAAAARRVAGGVVGASRRPLRRGATRPDVRCRLGVGDAEQAIGAQRSWLSDGGQRGVVLAIVILYALLCVRSMVTGRIVEVVVLAGAVDVGAYVYAALAPRVRARWPVRRPGTDSAESLSSLPSPAAATADASPPVDPVDGRSIDMDWEEWTQDPFESPTAAESLGIPEDRRQIYGFFRDEWEDEDNFRVATTTDELERQMRPIERRGSPEVTRERREGSTYSMAFDRDAADGASLSETELVGRTMAPRDGDADGEILTYRVKAPPEANEAQEPAASTPKRQPPRRRNFSLPGAVHLGLRSVRFTYHEVLSPLGLVVSTWWRDMEVLSQRGDPAEDLRSDVEEVLAHSNGEGPRRSQFRYEHERSGAVFPDLFGDQVDASAFQEGGEYARRVAEEWLGAAQNQVSTARTVMEEFFKDALKEDDDKADRDRHRPPRDENK